MSIITHENLPQLLETCRPALMAIWVRYASQMERRGFTVEEIMPTVAEIAWEHREQFRGQTVQFCAWVRTIFERWITAELDRKRPVQMDSQFDASDPGQPRPSQDYRSGLQQKAYANAWNDLPEHERVLIDLRFLRDLSVGKVKEALQMEYPRLWEEHKAEWDSWYLLDKACDKADRHFRDLVAKKYGDLGGSDDAVAPA